MILSLIVFALLLTLASGIPGLLIARSRTSQNIATALHLARCLAGLAAAALVFLGSPYQARFPWPLPGGFIAIRIDQLSAFFLVPLFVVMGLGSIYGHGYWNETKATGPKLRFFYGLLTAGFTLVLIAADAWSFLIGWEILGLSAFFLVRTESNKVEALRAAWIYLIATHASALILFAMFGVMRTATGSWLMDQVITNGAFLTPLLLLAMAGFGIKAGMMPFHVWLPEAHAAAPSHVSAVLSGVVLKAGIYGLVRVVTLVDSLPGWFGPGLLSAGIVSGILGVVFALAQHDLKRLLAYHSIENIGIILIGLGAGLIGRHESWGVFAVAGAMLHVWNHAFFKALLFFASGSVLHATGTRTIDALGGLLRTMPVTAFAFLAGAVAICGLPPLNGFVSEWLIYLASFRTVTLEWRAAILAAPALALIGALAVACFVKAFSVVFLGNPRSSYAGHKEPFSMRLTMLALVGLCLLIGIWPASVYSALSQVASLILGGSNTEEIALLFTQLPVASLLLLLLIAVATVAAVILGRRKTISVTWECGYAAPTTRMQYTASSFASPITGLFRWALRPEIHNGKVSSLFQEKCSFESHVPDPVLERWMEPAVARMRQIFARARVIHAGHIQIYIVYIVVTLLILLAWSSL